VGLPRQLLRNFPQQLPHGRAARLATPLAVARGAAVVLFASVVGVERPERHRGLALYGSASKEGPDEQ
jgi:hypothetical protein